MDPQNLLPMALRLLEVAEVTPLLLETRIFWYNTD